MAKDWTSLRLQRSTADRLRALQAKILNDYSEGKRELPRDQQDGVTVDWLIGWLMDQVDAHRNRAKKQRTEKLRKRLAALRQPEGQPEQ